MRNAAASLLPRRLTRANVVLSLGLTVPLLAVYLVYRSQLALAQTADSFTDALTALALGYSLAVGARPADEDHPRGHHRAEPIAALVAAVLAGVLAVEVFREALGAVLGEAQPSMGWALAGVFALKAAGKTVMTALARKGARSTGSPALRALEVDGRNDVLVGLLALGGFFAARFGSPGWDAYLALPVALWIGLSGLALALENIRLLMGEAAPPERQRELTALARAVPGVLSTHALTARFEGTQLDLQLHVVVDEELTVRAAHDIAETVERRLLEEQDVLGAMVHVDVDYDHSAAGDVGVSAAPRRVRGR